MQQNHRVLVTGGTGDLGGHVVKLLQAQGYLVRIGSRRARPATADSSLEWAQMALATGEGVAAGVQGVQTIIHCASSSTRPQQDVLAAEHLLREAQAAGVAHFIYISIVGVDQMPFAYYRAKLQVEAQVEASGLPYSILRAPQFFTLMDMAIGALARLPIVFVPKGFLQQPMATEAAARPLAELVAAGPSGRVPDIGGPCVHSFAEMARMWLQVRGQRKPVVELPIWGKAAAANRAGHGTVPQNALAGQTMEEWLRAKYWRA